MLHGRNEMQKQRKVFRFCTRWGVTFKRQKRVGHCDPIPTPIGLKMMLKTRKNRKKKKLLMRSTWQRPSQVCTTHKLSSNSSGVDHESNATRAPAKTSAPAIATSMPTAPVACAKTSAPEPAGRIEPPRPAIATRKRTAPVACAKTSAPEPAGSIKPPRPVQQPRVQAGPTDTRAKTAEPAPVVQTLPSGAPVDKNICDGRRTRMQFRPFGCSP